MAFTTPEGLFKPTLMFFSLTNSLVICQTMMNKILWNLINTGKVVSFIDNIIIGTKRKKGYDKLVEEVVRRLAENNLYVKLEKCQWKVKEVRFLEVVIRSEEIKIEEEKVKGILDWPTLKGVRNVQKFLGLANYYCQFIKDFVTIARLLYNMVLKKIKSGNG